MSPFLTCVIQGPCTQPALGQETKKRKSQVWGYDPAPMTKMPLLQGKPLSACIMGTAGIQGEKIQNCTTVFQHIFFSAYFLEAFYTYGEFLLANATKDMERTHLSQVLTHCIHLRCNSSPQGVEWDQSLISSDVLISVEMSGPRASPRMNIHTGKS